MKQFIKSVNKENRNSTDTDAWLLVGLGNPGRKYADTWHNCGYLAIDYLADQFGIRVNNARFKAAYGQGQISGVKVHLLKPETYMNNSGESVRQAIDYFKIPLDHVVIFYDDIDIDVGQLRIREKGGAGTHNGMRSVIQHIGGTDFPRFRIGIGPQPRHQDIIDYVLATIPDNARPKLKTVMDLIVSGVSYLLTADIQLAMNRVNTSNKKNPNGGHNGQSQNVEKG